MKQKLIRESISLNEAAEARDVQRIRDLFPKSKGDDAKLLQLTTNMAKSIDSVEKAQRRAEAAWQVLGPENNPIADIFLARVHELTGGKAPVAKTPEARKAIMASAPVLPAANPEVSSATHKQGVIFLPSYSAIAIWDWELTGQFSDGAWENARPDDHWKFWCDLDPVIGQPEVCAPGYPRKNGYGFGVLLQYDLGDRMTKYGRFGKAVGAKILKYGGSFSSIVEEFPADGPFDLEYYKEQQQKGWRKDDSYWKNVTQSDIDAYYATIYTEKDMKKDLSIIKTAMKNITRRFKY